MNINDSQAFTDQLAKMSPASSGMDPRRVFYEAGFKAGGNGNTASANSHPTSIVAACLMTLALVAPASFYAGANQEANSNATDRLVEQSPEQSPEKSAEQSVEQSPEKSAEQLHDAPTQGRARPTDTRPRRREVIRPRADPDSKPAPAPTGNDAGPVLANRPAIMRELSQWAQSLLPYKERYNSIANHQSSLSMFSIGHGTWLSQSEETVAMLDGAIRANTRNTTSQPRSENINKLPKFAPTPNALLKYFNSLETVQ